MSKRTKKVITFGLIAALPVMWIFSGFLRLRLFNKAADRILNPTLAAPSRQLSRDQVARTKAEIDRLRRSVAPKVILFYPLFRTERRRLEAGIGAAAMMPLWNQHDYDVWIRGVTSNSSAEVDELHRWLDQLLTGPRGAVHAL
jgi:hypothetical protein